MTLDQELEAMGLYRESEWYYIGPWRQLYGESSRVVQQCMEDRGYKTEMLWDGVSVLCHFTRAG